MTEQKQVIMNDLGVVPLTKWNDYFDFPTTKALKNYIYLKKDGIDKCYSKVGGRIYIKLDSIKEWLNGNV